MAIKVTSSTGSRDLLNSIIRKNNPTIFRLLDDTWNQQSKGPTRQEIRTSLENGSLSQSVLKKWRSDYDDYLSNMKGVYENIYSNGGQFVWDGMFKSSVFREPLPFDSTGTFLRDFYNNHAGEQITNLTATQQRGTNFLLNYFATEQPLSIAETERVLRGNVGLTEPQTKKLTKEISRWKAEGYSDKEIATKSFDFEQKRIKARAKLIATQETRVAYNAASIDAYAEASAEGLFPPELQPFKIWDARPKCCAKCCALQDQAVPISQPFSDGSTGPPQHVQCDCTMSTELREVAELSQVDILALSRGYLYKGSYILEGDYRYAM